jgi:hypothetical protein
MLFEEKNLLITRITENTYINCVDKTQRFVLLSEQVVRTVTAVVYKGLKMLCHSLM